MSLVERAKHAFRLSYGQEFLPGLTQPGENINYWENIKRDLESFHLPIPNIRTLAFLDLGGGSDWLNGRQNGDSGFTPYLCRYLSALGAPDVVNIDAGSVDTSYNDAFRHIQLKIKNDDEFSLVNELKKNKAPSKYDIIFSARFADILDPSPLLLSQIKTEEDIYELVERIKIWAKELLKPGGYLILYGDDNYVLKDGDLVSFSNL